MNNQKTNKHKMRFISTLVVTEAVVMLIAIICASYFGTFAAKQEPFDVSKTAINNEISIMNYNVRCIAVQDLGKKSWFYRADLIVDQIRDTAPDIITFQEVTAVHLLYLQRNLPGYDYEIKYRDDTLMSEGTPIFYRKDKFDKIDVGSFWLSETPDVMSKDWGAACYRICSYVILKEKSTSKEFVLFNTHLDHVSDEARTKGIDVVLSKIAQFGGKPAILTGDMNSFEGSVTYNKAVATFDDSKYIAASSDTGITYNGWGNATEKVSPIDFCFVSKGDFTVSSYKILDELKNGVYSSDHYPVVVKINLV